MARVGDIFKLDEDTVRTGRASFNLLVRAVILAVCLGSLFMLNWGLNEALGLVSGPIGLSENTEEFLSILMQTYVIFIAVAAIIQSGKDILMLMWYQTFGQSRRNGEQDE